LGRDYYPRLGMIKVEILKTGEIKEVKKNEAFALIDAGIAKVFSGYKTRMMSSEDTKTTNGISKKSYKIK
jgi:hypothetical protein